MEKFYKNKPLILALAMFILVLGLLVGYKDSSNNTNVSSNSENLNEASLIDLRLAQKSDSVLGKASLEEIQESDSLIANTIRAVSKKCTLDLSLVAQSSSVLEGGKVNYTMTVKNLGKTRCLNPSVSVYYSDNVNYVESTPKPTASNYYWKLANLALNQSYVVSFTTMHKTNIEDNNEIEIEACATADNGLDACTMTKVVVSPISSGGGGVVVTDPGTGEPPVTNPPQNGITKESGVWVWDSPIKMSTTTEQSFVNFASTNKLTVLYVTVDDYLDIYNLPDGADKETKKKAYSDALENFIKLANTKNIQVDALAGWRDWAEPGVTWKAFAIIDYVKDFNATRTTKLRAIQYDVEPYLLPTYESNKAKVLTNFVKLIDDSAKRLDSANIDFSIVIPHFYDSEQRWTPSFAYGGYTTHAFNHLLRIMNTRPNSSIILMSYRNFAEGADSTIEISQVEVAQASVAGSTTKIVVGQETGNVEPSYVTYYNNSRIYYESQIAIIKNTFDEYSNFGGIAVHYMDPFILLK